MTPLASCVDLGEVPAARLTPPMASNAMNAPTAAVAPFSTLRRVALLSPPGGAAPLLTIYVCRPLFASPAGDQHALDSGPHHRQTGERQHVWTGTGWQNTGPTTARSHA